MIVLDASAVLEFLLRTERGVRLAANLATTEDTLHAPHLLDLEVAHVLRRYVLRGVLPNPRATQALEIYQALDVQRYAHDLLLPRVWQLRSRLTAYDAAYVALAEGLSAVLLTADARLAATKGHRATIRVVP